MRRAILGMLVGTAVLAGCMSDSGTPLSEPSTESGAGPLRSPNACNSNPAQTIRRIEDLVESLFNGPDRREVLQRWKQVRKVLPRNPAAAKTQTYGVVAFILDAFNQGTLNPIPGGTDQGVAELVNLMFCFVGIPQTISLGPDAAAAVYQPGSPPLLLIAPSGFGGISLPPGTGTVTQPTVISLSRIQPDFPGPLLTFLDQYPLYYQFNTSSGETFFRDAVVSVCVSEDVFPPDPSRLRLAHNVPEPTPNTIEILPPATSFLDCTGAQTGIPGLGAGGGGLGRLALRAIDALAATVGALLSPDPLYAATLAVTGTTGTTKNLSPFGSVDTLGILDAASPPTGQTAPASGLVPLPPQVLVLTPTGQPIPGVAVTFTVATGGGLLTAVGSTTQVSTVVAISDATGRARVGTWQLGTVGSNTVKVTAAPPHALSGIDPLAGRTFTAIAQ